MDTQAQDLGPFIPEQGARSHAAVAAVVASFVSVAFAVLRVVADRMNDGDHGALTFTAQLFAILAIALGFAGMFETATRGRSGRSLVTFAFTIASITGLAAFVYMGTHDGTLRPQRFFTTFFDMDLMGLIVPSLARGAFNTIRLAFTAELLSLALGLVIASLRISPRRIFRWPALVYVDVVRGTPLLVLAFIIYAGLPDLGVRLPAFIGGVVILTVNGSAYVAEIFRAGLQSIPRGQRDAARSLGMTQGAAQLFVVIPQAVRAVIPPLMSDFIALTKDTAIVTIVIGFTVRSADLFGVARTAAASTFSATPFIGAAIGYLLITIPMTRLVGYAERKLRAGLV